MASGTQRKCFRFADFEIDSANQELKRDGVVVPLEHQPFYVLLMLVEGEGEAVTREALRSKLWPEGSHGDFDNGVNIAVRKVRQALGDSAKEPRYVQTLPRHGYRFLAPVEQDALPLRSIAVLPLENFSSEEDQEYFSDGMTETLITGLSRISSLKVISRTSVMQYKGVRRPLPEIARELGVEAIVTGSVQKEARRVRVCVQLIEAESDRHLWADSYERDLTSVLSLQSELAEAVANRIEVQLSSDEVDRFSAPRSVNADAYEAYLRGKFHMNRATPQGLQTALSLFQRALDIDQCSAFAHSGIADVLSISIISAVARPLEVGPRALTAARRAIDLDPESAQGHVSLGLLGHLHSYDWAAAEAAYRTALDLNPNNADANAYYAMLLNVLGREEEAERRVRRAIELDPLNVFFRNIRGALLSWSRRFEEAIVELDEVVARAPAMHTAHWFLWGNYYATGRYEESYASAVNVHSALDDIEMVETYQRGWRESGFAGAMLRGAEKLESRFQKTYVKPHVIAAHYDFCEQTDKVFEWLEKGFEEREDGMGFVNRVCFSDRVRSDARFHDLLERLQLPL